MRCKRDGDAALDDANKVLSKFNLVRLNVNVDLNPHECVIFRDEDEAMLVESRKAALGGALT